MVVHPVGLVMNVTIYLRLIKTNHKTTLMLCYMAENSTIETFILFIYREQRYN